MKKFVLKKTHLFFVISVLTICIAFGFYMVQSKNSDTEIDNHEIAPELTSFQGYYRAKILEVKEGPQEYSGVSPEQVIKVQILSGEEKGKELEIQHQDPTGTTVEQKNKPGDTVIIGKMQEVIGEDLSPDYLIVDKYRMPALGLIIGIFFALTIFLGRKRGVSSLLGLGFSIFLLTYFIVPRIISGSDPVLVSLVGSSAIILVSIFLVHGLSIRSALATISTFITLAISALMSIYFVPLAQLFGLSSEEAYFIQSGLAGTVNLRGLLLAGIIIGTLGILDDVTTTQTAVVDELHKTNPNFTLRELYIRSISVGKEHIASLVNTLVLAYAGAALPLFLLLTISTDQPLWIVLNSEFMAEEIIRTLIGSITLILAVPISTLLAAYYFTHSEIPKETSVA